MRLFIYILVFLLCASSCTLEKRHYRSGFYIHSKHRVQTSSENISAEEKLNPEKTTAVVDIPDTAINHSLHPVSFPQTSTAFSSSENALVSTPQVEETMVTHTQVENSPSTPGFVPSLREKPSGGAIAVTTIALVFAIAALVLLLASVFTPSLAVASSYVVASLISAIAGALVSLVALFINFSKNKNEELQLLSIIAMILSGVLLLASFVTLLAMAVVGI